MLFRVQLDLTCKPNGLAHRAELILTALVAMSLIKGVLVFLIPLSYSLFLCNLRLGIAR